MRRFVPFFFFVLLITVFFWQFFLNGLLPVPADTIVGLYHPFRDLYAKEYPNGVPFKNFLVTDPVRQQYLWKELVISAEKKLELPLWNPYNFAGTPLLANFQAAPFYLFNFLFFIMPFSVAWSLVIFLGPLLGGLFMLLYLSNLNVNRYAGLLGAIVFSLCGFSIAWMEWGNISHVILWLPLTLLCIDKIFSLFNVHILEYKKKIVVWSVILLISLSFSFFAGYLQAFFYSFLVFGVYFLARWKQFRWQGKIFRLFALIGLLFVLITSIQWVPTLEFISLSARNIDQIAFDNPGWFIPWQNFIQFIAPDFFGNPSTLNYWGVWNYGEFVGYVGIIPLVLALFSLFFRRDKKTLFFGTIFFLSLIFAFPTFIAKLPYLLNIPFLSTAQPTRLLFLTTFSLAILSALGLDYLLKLKSKMTVVYPLVFIAIILIGLWIFIPFDHKLVVKSNLLLPTLLFVVSSVLFITLIIFKKTSRVSAAICTAIIIATSFDLLRFGWKFTPFTNKNYLFPQTNTTSFLQKQEGQFRVITTDSRILPPNFSSIYKISSVDGYDPLYIRRYGELIAAIERNRPDINPPFGFNRIINPHRYESRLVDLLGVKYVLSLSQLDSPKLIKVFQEGQTIVYENKSAMPRAFFVKNIKLSKDKTESIKMLFDPAIDLTQTGIIESDKDFSGNWKNGSVNIVQYSENKVFIETENTGEGFLILTDAFYPTWKAFIDGKEVKIYIADYNFRGIIVPSGKHEVEYRNYLFRI